MMKSVKTPPRTAYATPPPTARQRAERAIEEARTASRMEVADLRAAELERALSRIEEAVHDLDQELDEALDRAHKAETDRDRVVDELLDTQTERDDLRDTLTAPIDTLQRQALEAATTDPHDPAWDLYFHLENLRPTVDA